ncbi:MAG: hemerythrin family protein [Spirochaetaceae bacterium]|nr:hemerythrin family protein [Spirochaetaceae bacterium]
MAKYEWDDSLLTGQPAIDTQHKELFKAVNDLLETAEADKGGDAIKKSLDFLTDYTIKHFFDEQQIQQKYGYPDYQNHVKYHEEFKATVRDMSHQLILKGSSKALVDELCKKFGDWLVNHIEIQDKKLADYIRKKS